MFEGLRQLFFGRRGKPPEIKDSAAEIALFRRRCIVASVAVVALAAVLVGRMVFLQIYQHKLYVMQSDSNRIRVEPLPPSRGLIYDRNGLLLAENRPTYNLMITREQAEDADATIDRIVNVLALPETMRATLIERSRQRQRPYDSALLLSDLNEWQIARLSLNRYRLPGVDVEPQLLRHYTQSVPMSHVLGYVGRMNRDDMNRLDNSNYAGTHFVGKLGIERQYEDILHGKVGMRRVETNAHGRVLGEIDRTAPVKGKDLTLTVDSHMQQLGMNLLEGRRGAIVAIQPATGQIIAMVSSPGFDANAFVTGISTKDYQRLQNDKDLPLYTRASRGEYPPASTVKPYMALAGLQQQVIRPQDTVFDPGYYRLPNDPHRYRNWFRPGHGTLNMHRAIALSNDTYFFNLAHLMGIQGIDDFLQHFGYGTDTALDVYGARPGVLPSPEWKRKRFNKPWYSGETLSVGVGQGYFLATPLQMATSLSVLANRGHWVRPHLLAGVNDASVNPPFEGTPPDIKLNNPSDWDVIIGGMKSVADNSATLRNRDYSMAAKTGTAQVFTVGQNARYNAHEVAERLRDHSLFSAFAPVDNPQIAVAVIVENGGWGNSAAAPIGKRMVDEWMHSTRSREVTLPDTRMPSGKTPETSNDMHSLPPLGDEGGR